jgi:hypothetical protein
VRDRPAVLGKCVLDDVVINVWSRHIKNLCELTPPFAIIRLSGCVITLTSHVETYSG